MRHASFRGSPHFAPGLRWQKLPLVEGHENMAVISSIKGTKTLEEALDRFENRGCHESRTAHE